MHLSCPTTYVPVALVNLICIVIRPTPPFQRQTILPAKLTVRRETQFADNSHNCHRNVDSSLVHVWWTQHLFLPRESSVHEKKKNRYKSCSKSGLDCAGTTNAATVVITQMKSNVWWESVLISASWVNWLPLSEWSTNLPAWRVLQHAVKDVNSDECCVGLLKTEKNHVSKFVGYRAWHAPVCSAIRRLWAVSDSAGVEISWMKRSFQWETMLKLQALKY